VPDSGCLDVPGQVGASDVHDLGMSNGHGLTIGDVPEFRLPAEDPPVPAQLPTMISCEVVPMLPAEDRPGERSALQTDRPAAVVGVADDDDDDDELQFVHRDREPRQADSSQKAAADGTLPAAAAPCSIRDETNQVLSSEVCTMIQNQHEQLMGCLGSWISRQEKLLEQLMERCQPKAVPPPVPPPCTSPKKRPMIAVADDHSGSESGCSGDNGSLDHDLQDTEPDDNSLQSALSDHCQGQRKSIRASIIDVGREIVKYATQTPVERSVSRLIALDRRMSVTSNVSRKKVKTKTEDDGDLNSEESVHTPETPPPVASQQIVFPTKKKCAKIASGAGKDKARFRTKSVRFSVESDTFGHVDLDEDEYSKWSESVLMKNLRRVVRSTRFEVFFGFTIVTNAIFMGIEVDWTAANPFQQVPTAFYVVGYLYTAVFAAELTTRIIVDGRKFVWNDSSIMMWNYLDIMIVLSSISEALIDLATTISGLGEDKMEAGPDMSKLRIIRIVRVARLMRLFRIGRIVRFIRALRTLVYSILCTLKSVVWSMLLLIIIMYTFGILFTQAASDFEVSLKIGDSVPLTPQSMWALEYHWGTLADSMLTLFMSISGGVSWLEVCKPLREVGILWLFVFLAFISFTYFAVLNVVTGIFCQCAIESASHDQEAMVQAFVSYKQLYITRFKKLFHHMDEDDSGFITKEEFLKHIEDTNVNAFFATLGIDSMDAVSLFKLIGTDSTQRGIDIEDFVLGCLRLKGNAKSCDIARLMYENRLIQHELVDLVCFVDASFKELLGEKAKPVGKFFRSSKILFPARKMPRDSTDVSRGQKRRGTPPPS